MITFLQTQLDSIINAINSRAKLASPALTGTPTAPTAALGDNTTKIATTAFVLANAGGGAGGTGGSAYVGLTIVQGTLHHVSNFNINDVDTTINTTAFSVNEAGELTIII